MPRQFDVSFQRYLAAKQPVDDRALNRVVWEALRRAVAGTSPLHVLEVGAGIGTMAERLVEWDLAGVRAGGRAAEMSLTLVDALPENMGEAKRRLRAWGQARGLDVGDHGDRIDLRSADLSLAVTFVAEDLFAFAARHAGGRRWDLLVAHAVLDLLDVSRALSRLTPLLRAGGLLYTTLVFDGVTAFEPAVDADLDALIERLYHQTMDDRRTDGAPSGDSRAGRHLFHQATAAGLHVLAMGSSDWLVLPGAGGYPGDEAYFLRFIVNTVETALAGHAHLPPERLAAWADARRAQIERCELVYIAHQVDMLARVMGTSHAG
jgi:hypothetical protein